MYPNTSKMWMREYDELFENIHINFDFFQSFLQMQQKNLNKTEYKERIFFMSILDVLSIEIVILPKLNCNTVMNYGKENSAQIGSNHSFNYLIPNEWMNAFYSNICYSIELSKPQLYI